MKNIEIGIISLERFIFRRKYFYDPFAVTVRQGCGKLFGIGNLGKAGKVNLCKSFKMSFKKQNHLFIGFSHFCLKNTFLFVIEQGGKNKREESQNRCEENSCFFSYAADGFNHITARPRGGACISPEAL
jgi:hypothetical protein